MAPMALSHEELEDLPRRKLQQLAKEAGLKANGKSTVIIEALLRTMVAEEDVSPSQEQQQDKKNGMHVAEEIGFDAGKESIVTLSVGSVDPEKSLEHRTLERAVISSGTRRLPTQGVRGEAKSVKTPLSVVRKKRKSSIKTAVPISTAFCDSPSSGKKRRMSNRLAENVAADANKQQQAVKEDEAVATKKQKIAPKSAIKTRFDRAHEKLFRTQKSIVDHHNRSKSSVKALRPQASQKMTTPAVSRHNAIPFNVSSVKKSAASFRQQHTAQSTSKLTTPANNIKGSSSNVASSANAGLSVTEKTTAASELGKKQKIIYKTEKATPASAVKKFDLAASLKRPITWEMKKGKCV